MKLPNGERAFVDIAKLRDYCLNPNHDDGKHKARVFASALGLRRSDAEWLRQRLLEAATHETAIVTSETLFGTIYMIKFGVTTVAGSVIINSNWIIRNAEDFPRLVTCYVK